MSPGMARRNPALDVLLGAAAGAAATWLMDKLTSALYERESEEVRKREEDVRGGSTTYENAAAKYLGDKDLAPALHWSSGIAAGALYGLLRNRVDLSFGTGVLFGVAFFAAVDEGVMTALKLAPPPNAFPWQSHARGLAGHLVLGAVIESAFDVVDLAA